MEFDPALTVDTEGLLLLPIQTGNEGNDVISGIDLTTSLLLGSRPTAQLLPQKGAALAPVPAVVSSDATEDGVVRMEDGEAEEPTGINFVIGLDDQLHRRHATPPAKAAGAGLDGPFSPPDAAAGQESVPASPPVSLGVDALRNPEPGASSFCLLSPTELNGTMSWLVVLQPGQEVVVALALGILATGVYHAIHPGPPRKGGRHDHILDIEKRR